MHTAIMDKKTTRRHTLQDECCYCVW